MAGLVCSISLVGIDSSLIGNRTNTDVLYLIKISAFLAGLRLEIKISIITVNASILAIHEWFLYWTCLTILVLSYLISIRDLTQCTVPQRPLWLSCEIALIDRDRGCRGLSTSLA